MIIIDDTGIRYECRYCPNVETDESELCSKCKELENGNP